MSKEYMCTYGNCTETKIKIVMTISSERRRLRFCSNEHAIKWLQEH